MARHTKYAIVFGIIGMGLVIGAWAAEWYRVEYKDGDNKSSTFFYWDHTVTTLNDNSRSNKYDKDSDKNVKQTFDTCLAFLTIGGALLLGSIIINMIRQFGGVKNTMVRYLSILVIIAADVLLCISFFSFLNITKAFKDDKSIGCITLGIPPTYDKYYCSKFVGKDDEEHLLWIGGVGWWLLLGAIIFTSITVGQTLQSKK